MGKMHIYKVLYFFGEFLHYLSYNITCNKEGVNLYVLVNHGMVVRQWYTVPVLGTYGRAILIEMKRSECYFTNQ